MDYEGIMKHSTEYFTDPFYNSSIIDKNVINNLPQKDIILEMMDHPTINEIQKMIKEINAESDKFAAAIHLSTPVFQD